MSHYITLTPDFAFICVGFPSAGKTGSLQWKETDGDGESAGWGGEIAGWGKEKKSKSKSKRKKEKRREKRKMIGKRGKRKKRRLK